MKHWLSCCVALCLTAAASHAREIDFLETFALAEDREAALKLLIPGTEEHFYYHCLHYQQTQQFEQVEQLLQEWVKQYHTTPRVREIRHRQALLQYANNRQQTLDYVRDQLKLRFDHQPQTADRVSRLPSRLDPAAISRARLSQQALRQHQDLSGFRDPALDWLVTEELTPTQRRHLLERLSRPDYPGLPQLIVDDLQHRGSRGFGSLPIHHRLLTRQLEECARLRPRLLNETEFVNIYLRKLQPSPDEDWQYELAARTAYLERLGTFVSRLDPAHNSLKAHVLYHRLIADQAQGIHDEERFLAYLRLPRQMPYANPRYLELTESRRYPADLTFDCQSVTLMPPVFNDEPLVRSYLAHFFVEADSYQLYEPFVNDVYLKHLFAETKLVNGLGDAQRWYAMLPPAQLQALKDRVDIEFAPTNPRQLAVEDPVQLDIDLKNVSTLIVKVYEINARSYYQRHLQEINTDIPLDGLVANSEQTYTYSEPPLRRVRQSFSFPQLTRPGVFVLDFIGNGRSSRVVLRKGRLQHVVRTTSAGHVFTIFDEQRRKVDDATLWLAQHEYEADEDGTILVPFTTRPGEQAIVISRGDLSSLERFAHEAENYQLEAAFYVDRESLLQRETAQLIIRVQLRVNGIPVAVAALDTVRLVITSTDQEGIETTKEVEDFKLHDDRESVYEFHVPPRLRELRFAVRARVKSLSEDRQIDLEAGDQIQINGIDTTPCVADAHLLHTSAGYTLNLLGRSGEPLGHRPLQLRLAHRDFAEPVQVTLKTDDAGHIELGTLPDVVQISATLPAGTTRHWPLRQDQHTYPPALHRRVGEPLQVPYMGTSHEPQRDEVSLLELRGESFAVDRFEALRIEDGYVRIDGLEAGDYDLLLKHEAASIRLRITDGQLVSRHLVGPVRNLEIRHPNPLQIRHVAADDQSVRIQLGNSTEFTRVHVLATRFVPEFSAFESFSRVGPVAPRAGGVTPQISLYVTGRDIGDEYRYILERKQARKFPGNMLARPELLLNPWAVRDTETAHQLAADGEVFAPSEQPARAPAPQTRALGDAIEKELAGFSNLDFLADTSTVLSNLKPDGNGIVTVPRDALGPHQHLHFVAIDPATTVCRSVALAPVETTPRDLRLLDSLDPDGHFTQQKQTTLLAAGQQFELADITASRFEVYDSLARVYALYLTLTGDDKLAQFDFVVNWPKLSDQDKRAKYSEFACHELNYFLYHKDRAFFAQVVRPYLVHKRDKTFLDKWLLELDVSSYLQPWQYAQLNLPERVLLGQRIEAEHARTARHVHDLFRLLPDNVEQRDFLFASALGRSSLDADDATGFRAARGALKLERSKEISGRLGQLRRGEAPASEKAGFGGGRDVVDGAPDTTTAMDDADAEESAPQHLSAARVAGDRKQVANEMREDYVAGEFGVDLARRGRAERFYRKLEATQEWAENNYYQLPIQEQNAELVTVNTFWDALAAHPARQPFLSGEFPSAARNFTEMMLALAALDLPFEAEAADISFDQSRMTLTCKVPAIVFHQEIREVPAAEETSPILVSQNFFRHGDRYQQVNGEQEDKFVTEEFLRHAVYGGHLVVTNPSSARQKVELLIQIPPGAVPVNGSKYTRSVPLDLQPYHTKTVEYYFYFPAAGDYRQFPVHIARNERLLAHADPFTFHVVEALRKSDRDSWEFVSQQGTNEEVLAFLNARNVQELDLDRIAFRMQDADFFRSVLSLLSERHVYNQTLWSYGIKHQFVPAIQQFLQHADEFVAQCGAVLDSPLLVVDPIERRSYEHLEYRPLVNARVHRLGPRRTILNDRFYEQYHRYLRVISYLPRLDNRDWLGVTYYLLLQDRIEEGLAAFAKVRRSQLPSQLQYDYLAAYLDCFQIDPQLAPQIVAQYDDYPVDRWRLAFANIRAVLDEAAGSAAEVVNPKDRNQTQAQQASQEPILELKVESGQVRLDYRNLKQAVVNYYRIDLELLFSRSPFMQQQEGQFASIRPNFSRVLDLPAGENRLVFELPPEFRGNNLLVEVTAAGKTRSQLYYANSLSVELMPNYGQVRVTSLSQGHPLPAVYVKAYAEMRDGSVRFYKDGYTDIRGRFDYTSLSTSELDAVRRFSLLVLSDEHGAVVREALPPKQ